MIHVGMASNREFYSIERRGHREVYDKADVDGVVLGDEKEKKDWVWEGLPNEILTDLAMDDVLERWITARPASHNLLGL